MNINNINCVFIGSQKAGTSSLYHWLSQHPEVFGPDSSKDFAFFSNDNFYKNGSKFIEGFYTEYAGQKIVLHGNVNYSLFTHALARMRNDCPNAKFIMILRNPVDRAISAYNYFYKLGLEDLSFHDAIMADVENRHLDFKAISDKTYIRHGFYYKQIESFYELFDKSRLHLLLFEEMIEDPLESLKSVFDFLAINKNFSPNLKLINETGDAKIRVLNKFMYTSNGVKTFLKDKLFLERIVPLKIRIQIRKHIRDWNTKEASQNKVDIDKHYLYSLFKEDILKLEDLTGLNLKVWKKYE